MNTYKTQDSIKELLERSDLAVERAILAIYARQTADEQITETTSHKNGVGFSGVDAEILSSFAQQIERKSGNGVKIGHCLSEKQMAIARRKMMRYSRQLLEVAEEKANAISNVEVEVKEEEIKVTNGVSGFISLEPERRPVTRIIPEGYHSEATDPTFDPCKYFAVQTPIDGQNVQVSPFFLTVAGCEVWCKEFHIEHDAIISARNWQELQRYQREHNENGDYWPLLRR